jgi:hypothetical protein
MKKVSLADRLRMFPVFGRRSSRPCRDHCARTDGWTGGKSVSQKGKKSGITSSGLGGGVSCGHKGAPEIREIFFFFFS